MRDVVDITEGALEGQRDENLDAVGSCDAASGVELIFF